MDIVNLTPHDVVVVVDGKLKTFMSEAEAYGGLPRVQEKKRLLGHINNIPIVQIAYGEVENLPAPRDGFLYIVSTLVRERSLNRRDLVSPTGFVRDGNGRIVGCAEFAVSFDSLDNDDQ